MWGNFWYQSFFTKEPKKFKKRKDDADESWADECWGRYSQFCCYSSKHLFCIQFLPMVRCTSTISKITTPMDLMCMNLTWTTRSCEPSLNKRKFCPAMSENWKTLWMRLWTHPFMNPSLRKEKWFVYRIFSCCLVKRGLIHPPLLKSYFQTQKIASD